ncbi:hypothetical protein D3C81_948730 [compost metagenome]
MLGETIAQGLDPRFPVTGIPFPEHFTQRLFIKKLDHSLGEFAAKQFLPAQLQRIHRCRIGKPFLDPCTLQYWLLENLYGFVAWPPRQLRHETHGAIGPFLAHPVGQDLVHTTRRIDIGPVARECVAKQRGRGFVLDMQPAQGIFVHATGGQNLLQSLIGDPVHRSAQAPEQLALAPFERLIEFALPSAGAIVFQQRLISVGAGRVVQTMPAGGRVLLDLIAFAIEAQQVLILMSIQSLIAGLRLFGHHDRLLIRAEVRVP